MSQTKLLSLLLILTFIISPSLPQSFCRTPGRKMGRCISIYNCGYLLNILQSNSLTQKTVSFLQLSQCVAETDTKVPHVCCARNDDSLILDSDMNATHLPALSAVFEDSKAIKKEKGSNLEDSIDSTKAWFNLLPSRSECGRETIENRIYSGQDTSREEFPWTALLEYRTASGEISINCGGSLISKKYVLSASHCLQGDITLRVGPLENIRLGDYDLRQSDSCDVRGRRCGNPYRFNEIDEIIPHEKFNHRAINRRNDIGLVRLKRAVKFSNTIRPVCLPASNSNPLKAGDSVYVAGFGRTLQSRTSPVKQKLRIPIYNQNECTKKFATKNVEIHNDQLCAGGEFSRDACDGDSGNGLVRFQNNWVVEGIVSFGYLCGLQGWPAIYTRVDKYIDWIETHMRR